MYVLLFVAKLPIQTRHLVLLCAAGMRAAEPGLWRTKVTLRLQSLYSGPVQLSRTEKPGPCHRLPAEDLTALSYVFQLGGL